MAGCALGVVSERGERSSSRRVRISRRCEFGVDGKWYPASIEDVSVHGAKVHVFGKNFDPVDVGTQGAIRFRPYSTGSEETLGIIVRNSWVDGDVVAVGSSYVPTSALDHRLIADLIFANSEQWTQFQRARRRNPGLIKGTLWFIGLSLYQTNRGLIYLFRSLAPKAEKQREPARASVK
jgi:cellulose synthase (UDP-forming)